MASAPQAVAFLADANQFVSVTAIADGRRLSLQLDGVTVLDTTDQSSDALVAGHVGLVAPLARAGWGAAQFSDLSVSLGGDTTTGRRVFSVEVNGVLAASNSTTAAFVYSLPNTTDEVYPRVSSIFPLRGGNGTVLTVHGSNFPSDPSVTLGSSQCDVLEVSAGGDTLKCTVGPQ